MNIASKNNLFSNIGQRLKKVGRNISNRLSSVIESPWYGYGKKALDLFSAFVPNPVTPLISQGLGWLESGQEYLKEQTKKEPRIIQGRMIQPTKNDFGTRMPQTSMETSLLDPIKALSNEEDNLYLQI